MLHWTQPVRERKVAARQKQCVHFSPLEGVDGIRHLSSSGTRLPGVAGFSRGEPSSGCSIAKISYHCLSMRCLARVWTNRGRVCGWCAVPADLGGLDPAHLGRVSAMGPGQCSRLSSEVVSGQCRGTGEKNVSTMLTDDLGRWRWGCNLLPNQNQVFVHLGLCRPDVVRCCRKGERRDRPW